MVPGQNQNGLYGRSTEDKKMSFVVRSNISSMNVQRQLGKTTSNLETSFQRLSSGLRINSAKDDAAGLAITERMDAQVRGMEVARRNAADAVSLSQTVESGLGEVTGILQRLRELSVQAANDTNTVSDRKTLDAEASQLIQLLDQIATSTEFNGQKVLDGTISDMTFQIGANNQADQSLTVQLGGVRAGQLGQLASRESDGTVDGSAIGSATGQATVSINGNSINASSTFGADVGHDIVSAVTNEQENSAYAKAKAINATGIGVKAIASATTLQSASDFSAAGSAGYTLSINGTKIYEGSGAADIESLVNQINTHADETGVTAKVNGLRVDLTAVDGRNINLISDDGSAGTDGAGGFESSVAQTRANITLTSTENITMATGNNRLGYLGQSIVVDSNNLNTDVDLTTRDGALTAMDRLDAALDRVNVLRGRMGATQNRLESTSSNLAAITENLSAAKSRIKDADFARESATMTRNQILQ
jgi:flagellin